MFFTIFQMLDTLVESVKLCIVSKTYVEIEFCSIRLLVHIVPLDIGYSAQRAAKPFDSHSNDSHSYAARFLNGGSDELSHSTMR